MLAHTLSLTGAAFSFLAPSLRPVGTPRPAARLHFVRLLSRLRSSQQVVFLRRKKNYQVPGMVLKLKPDTRSHGSRRWKKNIFQNLSCETENLLIGSRAPPTPLLTHLGLERGKNADKKRGRLVHQPLRPLHHWAMRQWLVCETQRKE